MMSDFLSVTFVVILAKPTSAFWGSMNTTWLGFGKTKASGMGKNQFKFVQRSCDVISKHYVTKLANRNLKMVHVKFRLQET